MRAVARVVGISFNTLAKLLLDAADAADECHVEHVRGIKDRRDIQCDEIWVFIHCKEGHVEHATSASPEAGDSWTWTAIDSDSKLIVSYRVSPHRDGQAALEFMDDLSQRIIERPQLSTDGLKAYRDAVDLAFGGEVDFAQVVKEYGRPEGRRQRVVVQSGHMQGHGDHRGTGVTEPGQGEHQLRRAAQHHHADEHADERVLEEAGEARGDAGDLLLLV